MISSLKKELRSIVLSPGKNLSVTFDYMDRKITELDAAGGTVKDNDLVQYLHDALRGDYQRNTFWFHLRGSMSSLGLEKYNAQHSQRSNAKILE
jgi:hypothetical protein